MKMLLLLSMLASCSYHEDYKVGDCISQNLSNDFELDITYYRVLAVGKNDYLLREFDRKINKLTYITVYAKNIGYRSWWKKEHPMMCEE